MPASPRSPELEPESPPPESLAPPDVGDPPLELEDPVGASEPAPPEDEAPDEAPAPPSPDDCRPESRSGVSPGPPVEEELHAPISETSQSRWDALRGW